MNTTASQIIETLKGNKIGKGCKICSDGGAVTILYPLHKTLGGQDVNEVGKVKDLFSVSKTGNTLVKYHRASNLASIQIYYSF